MKFRFITTSLSLTHLATSFLLAGPGDTTAPPPLVTLANEAPVDLWSSARPDGHAPIGVMADHSHGRGEWMLSYRYVYMPMEQNYDGCSRIGDAEIISPGGEGFLVTPQWMDMEMHMFGLMYAPTDHLTMMLMLPYARKEMGHLRRDGVEFVTESEGWGDLKLTGIHELYHGPGRALLLNLGLSFPTGSIDEEDEIPGLGQTRLPYPMQIGSGTWDLLPGITYLEQQGDWSWGAQLSGVLRLGRNDEGYSLGETGQLTAWGAYRVNDSVSTSLRLTGRAWGNIDGHDDDLRVPSTVVPTADPDLRGGRQIDLSWGVNFYMRSGVLKGQRLAVEAGLPIYRDLDGPQLTPEWQLTLGWQWAF